MMGTGRQNYEYKRKGYAVTFANLSEEYQRYRESMVARIAELEAEVDKWRKVSAYACTFKGRQHLKNNYEGKWHTTKPLGEWLAEELYDYFEKYTCPKCGEVELGEADEIVGLDQGTDRKITMCAACGYVMPEEER